MASLISLIPFSLRRRRTLVRQAQALIAAARFDEADLLTDRGLRRFSDDPELLEQHALSANNSGRYAVALNRWDRLRRQEPDHRLAWAGVACNGRELGDVAAATTIIVEALDRFPNDALLLSEAHRILEAAPSPDKARLLQVLVASHAQLDLDDAIAQQAGPFGETSGFLGRAGRLAMAKADWKCAIAVAEAFNRAHPPSPAIDEILRNALHHLAAFAANARWGDPEEAHACFAIILRHEAHNPAWTAASIDTLIKLARYEEADCALRDAETRLPEHAAFRVVRANLHYKREEWDAAITILNAHLSHMPADVEAQELLAHVKLEQGYGLGANLVPPPHVPAPQDVGREESADTRDLLLGFESLGEDCEFGLVQRRFGAEPIGLFRWNTTRVAPLIAALTANLSGLGEPNHTIMSTWENVEYYVADRRWGFGMHTFCTRQEVDYDTLYPKMCRRLRYLRDKLLSDMESGAKTFVFKSDTASYAELASLQAALRTDAHARLLCVKQLAYAPDGHGVVGGEVYALGDGLYLGYVSRFGFQVPRWKILFDEWIAICRKVPDAKPLPFPETLI